MDMDLLAQAVEHLDKRLDQHVLLNKQQFESIDDSLSFLQEKFSDLAPSTLYRAEGDTMSDSTTDNVKIHNHAPAADPSTAMMIAALGNGNRSFQGDGFLGGIYIRRSVKDFYGPNYLYSCF